MDRTAFLRSLIDLNGIGLEIGPGYNPLLPKAAGFRVQTVDHTDADGLRAKYRDAGVDPSRIEEVDHVLADRSLADAIGERRHYDFIVASHVIEHTPDMLGFLRDCEALLNETGILLLAVPDKRYCFDVFQPLSSTGAVLQAHFDRRTRPPLSAIFDDRAYNAVRDGAIGWPMESTGALSFHLDLPAASAHFAADRQSARYIDVHVWKFVPSSFRLIIHDLNAIGELRLREHAFFDSVGNEFYMTLSERGHECGVNRLTLARRMLVEQARIVADHTVADPAAGLSRISGISRAVRRWYSS